MDDQKRQELEKRIERTDKKMLPHDDGVHLTPEQAVEAVRELVTEGKYHIPERRLLAIMTAILDEWPVLEGDSSGDLPLFYAMFAAGRQWGINERRDAEARAKTWFELS